MPLLQIDLVAASIVIPEIATTLNENRVNKVISVKKNTSNFIKKTQRKHHVKKVYNFR